MRKYKNKIIYSPTDITKYIDSPYASWMDRALMIEESLEEKKVVSETRENLFLQGKNLEDKYFEQLKKEAGEDFIIIDDNPKTSKEDTLKAIKKGYKYIAQAHLELAPFAGFADLLERKEGASKLGDFHYTVKDIKRSRVSKSKFILQICAYIEMLYEIQGVIPEEFSIILGDYSEESFKSKDYYSYYSKVKDKFLKFHESFNIKEKPIPSLGENCWEWGEEALDYLKSIDHLSLIAGISNEEIKKLAEHNISSQEQLISAKFKDELLINEEKFKKLQLQASLQKKSTPEKIEFQVLNHDKADPKGLLNFPEKHEQDCFIDLKYSETFDAKGLVYLYSVYYNENKKWHHKLFVCETKKNEKETFESFMGFLSKVNQDGKVYHFGSASYEILSQMANKYHTYISELDNLIFHHRLVDMSNTIKQSFVIGVRDYSLGNVAKVWSSAFVGIEEANLMNEYLFGDTPKEESLEAIKKTTLFKIRTIKEAYDWVREQQEVNKITFLPFDQREESKVEVEKKGSSDEEDGEEDQSSVEIIPFDEASYYDASPLEKGGQLLRQLVNFHQLESKPSFLDLLDKFKQSEDEWEKDLRCLAYLKLVGSVDEEKNAHKIKYLFDPTQETKIKEGDSVQFYQNRRLNGKVISMDINTSQIIIQVTKKHIGLVKSYKKISIISNNRIFTKGLEKAILDVYAKSGETFEIPQCAKDFILKEYPNVKNIEKGEDLYSENKELIPQAIEVIENMNSSCLIIQGPPGAGKTYTSSQIIKSLISKGKKVAISSNSHKAINNLLKQVAQICPDNQMAKINSSKEEELEQYANIQVIKSAKDFAADSKVSVLGATAFGMAHDSLVDKFDYLFIDEAGQVSIANLIAMSRSCKNIVLIGDQMQLEQPIQGIHPGDSGKSALEYFLGEHKTIPASYGFFLNTTRRMHPELCKFVSDNFYDSKLFSHEQSTKENYLILEENGLISRSAGVQYIPVEHSGNVQYSQEEVDEVERITQYLLTQKIKIDGKIRAISSEDIIYVSPYNMQVSKIGKKMPEARIGSVDLFQGQEAPIVIISLASSEGSGARGLEFLLSQNRLNVALSRGKCLAIVVASPKIITAKTDSIKGAYLLNIFSHLLDFE